VGGRTRVRWSPGVGDFLATAVARAGGRFVAADGSRMDLVDLATGSVKTVNLKLNPESERLVIAERGDPLAIVGANSIRLRNGQDLSDEVTGKRPVPFAGAVLAEFDPDGRSLFVINREGRAGVIRTNSTGKLKSAHLRLGGDPVRIRFSRTGTLVAVIDA